jgi:hypothetical protein
MNAPFKRCTCCDRPYTEHGWKLLPKIGMHRDWVEELELRNCPCGSTLAVVKRRFMRAEPHVPTLLARTRYGGKKGRAATRKLLMMGVVS